jgi:hypothetical protein
MKEDIKKMNKEESFMDTVKWGVKWGLITVGALVIGTFIGTLIGVNL